MTAALIVLIPAPPFTEALRELGLALMVKFTALDAATVSVTVVVLVNPPPVPDTVRV